MLFVLFAVLGADGSLLDTARQQLANHDDVAARKTLEKARAQAADQPELLSQVYLVLGLSWAEAANETKAIEAFGTALKLDPGLVLPENAAPKVRDWWKRAGGRDDVVVAPAPPPPPPPVAVEPVAVVAPPPPVVVAPKPSSNRPWLLIPGSVVAAISVGIGIGLDRASEGKLLRLNSPQMFDAVEAGRLAADGKSLQTGEWLAFSLAGAVAVAIVIYLLAR